jgi:hypothetical protein
MWPMAVRKTALACASSLTDTPQFLTCLLAQCHVAHGRAQDCPRLRILSNRYTTIPSLLAQCHVAHGRVQDCPRLRILFNRYTTIPDLLAQCYVTHGRAQDCPRLRILSNRYTTTPDLLACAVLRGPWPCAKSPPSL